MEAIGNEGPLKMIACIKWGFILFPCMASWNGLMQSMYFISYTFEKPRQQNY